MAVSTPLPLYFSNMVVSLQRYFRDRDLRVLLFAWRRSTCVTSQEVDHGLQAVQKLRVHHTGPHKYVAMPRDGADEKESPSSVDSEGFTEVGKGGRPKKAQQGQSEVNLADASGKAGGVTFAEHNGGHVGFVCWSQIPLSRVSMGGCLSRPWD